MKRDIRRYAKIARDGGLLAALRRGIPSAAPVPSSSGAEESADLHVYEWPGYDDPALFAEYLGRYPEARPSFTYVTNTEEAIRHLREGLLVDLVHAEVGYTQDFVDLGAIQPFDVELIPNFVDLDPAMTARGRIDGDQYLVPLEWGFSVPLYDADRVEPERPSYDLLFDRRYAGRICWNDTPWMLVVAGYVHAAAEPWDMTDQELEDAKAFLIDRRRLLHHLSTNRTELDRHIREGDVWIAYAWNSSYVAALRAGVNAVFLTDVEEGAISWTEGFVLAAGCENYHHAHAYVDAWASRTTAEWLMENYGSGHSNLTADRERLDPAITPVPRLGSAAVSDTPRIHIDRYIARRATYIQAWEDVKSA